MTVAIITVDKSIRTPEEMEQHHNINQNPPKRNQRYLLLNKMIAVAIFSYLGVLVRVLLTKASGLSHSFDYLDSGFLLPNIVGCFAMGLMTVLVRRYKSWPILSTGIMTGFCGSCTTFATWIAKGVKEFAVKEWVPGLIQLAVTIGLSQAAFVFGSHSGRFIVFIGEKFYPKVRRSHPQAADGRSARSISYRSDLYRTVFLVVTFVLSTSLFWALAFVDTSATMTNGWIAVCFGPLGALLRFALSLLNPRVPNFPWFTFIVNVSASVIDVMIYIGNVEIRDAIGSTGSITLASYNFWVLAGISTGAMGSLSTVSTWINELNGLSETKLWFAYRYGLTTFIFTQILSWVAVGIWMGVGNRF